MADVDVPLSNATNSSQQQQQQNGHTNGHATYPPQPPISTANLIDETDFDGGNSTARLFERTRIQVLADEREMVQKKTFTKWINSHLARAGCANYGRVNDLYIDLRDGRLLIRLLEILSSERLPRPTRGKMRIHCLENVDKALLFLQEQHVHLENIGAHDIVDGNGSLTLGLIWTIILRFQIQIIDEEYLRRTEVPSKVITNLQGSSTTGTDSPFPNGQYLYENKEKRSAKDALLLWCQIKTADYSNVNVRNFTTSWRDGLAFNALIHKHRPDLINYSQLQKQNANFNLNNAFTVAEKKLNISRILDIEDVNVESPDEKIIMTYVVSFYHYFSKMKDDQVQGKRIAKVVGSAIQIDRDIKQYESLTSQLLEWIRVTIEQLSDRQFANSLQGVQQQLAAFNQYRMNEKCLKFSEKGNLEVLLFTIQSKIRAQNQRPYLPREGKLISDINRAWADLEKAEHERELALREELVRQENLEQLASKFNKKATMREKWLNDSQKLVISDQFGFDLESVEAAFKKQEAIQTDIGAFEERVRNVIDIAKVLEKENYHDIERINARKRNVYMLWNYLLELVKARRQRLESSYSLQKIFQEMQQLNDYLEDLSKLLQIDNYGKHLISVEDLLQRHKLVDVDISLLGDKVARVSQDALAYFQQLVEMEQQERSASTQTAEALATMPRLNDSTLITEKINHLQEVYTNVKQLSHARQIKLEEAHKYWQLVEDFAEEELWISEKRQQLSVPDEEDWSARFNSRVVQEEMNAHRNLQFERLAAQARQLVEMRNYSHEQISERLELIETQWLQLQELVKYKQQKQANLNETKQFFTDCEDVDSYLFELNRMLNQSAEDDYHMGKDEITLLNLLKKHKDLEEDFFKYKQIVQNVHEQAAQLPDLKQLELEPGSLGDDQEEKRLRNLLDQVQQRLKSLDRRYSELNDMFRLRKLKLNDQLSYIRLQNDADNVEEWIDEKERFLATLDPTTVKDIEALEVIKHRFDGFEREMNSNAPKVAVVNQLARQLVSAQQQQQINQQTLSASTQNISEAIDSTNLSQPADLSSNQLIQDRINKLNSKWSALRKLVDKKRDDLTSTFGVQTFHIESQETISWIQDKIRVIQSTEHLGNDLSGVMQMQRRLSGLERDMAAILAKKDQLEQQAQALEKDHPQESLEIRERLDEITHVWRELKDLLNKREETMGEAAELQKFLRDLDHFSAWLTKTQTAVASSEQPNSLVDAEQMLNQHQTIKEEIDRYVPDYSRMKEYGDRVCQNADASDSQYLFLRERLNGLDQGWNKLDQMWRHRQLTLSEDLNLEIFRRDAKQAEQVLANQEYYLKQIPQPKSLEDAEQMLRKHQDFITSARANKDKIDGVSQSARSLAEDQHRDAANIQSKASDIKKRFSDNENRSLAVLNRLRDSVRYYQFLQDCDELKEWLEYKQIQAQDESYRDTKNIHMKYLRHKGFESEIQANRNRLEQLEQQSKNLFNFEASSSDEAATSSSEEGAQVQPQIQPDLVDHQLRAQIKEELEKRLSDLNNQWDNLEKMTKLKGEKLFDANRGILFEQSVDSIDIWIKEMERHIQYTTQRTSSSSSPDQEGTSDASDLTTTNLLLDKQREIEAQLLARQKQVDELKQQAALLKETEPDKSVDIDSKRERIEERFAQIVQPLEEKKKQLQQQKRMFQFLRDCDDELLWIEEKLRQAKSPNVGASLVEVNMFQRKNDTLQKEVDNHDQRIQQVCQDGENMIQESHPRAEEFQHLIASLQAQWQELKLAIDERRQRLDDSQRVQQYFFDCSEAEAWMGEQELYMMSDAGMSAPVPTGVTQEAQTPSKPSDKDVSASKWCKDEQNAHSQLKKHLQLESEVEDHAVQISNLGEISRLLCANYNTVIGEDGGVEQHLLLSGHTCESISKRQMQIDKMYAGLKDLASERRQRLEETVKLFLLHRDIDDLEQWIADKVIVAGSNDDGQDFDHVNLLKERFRQFSSDTQQIGQERVNLVTAAADVLVDSGHADSALISQWSESLNSAWEDLLELMRTRTLLLDASWQLHKYFSDCKEVLAHIDEKKKCIPDEVGRDAQSVAQLQRRHATFEENDLITLGGKVHQIQEEANKLHGLYAGDRAKEIKDRELEVLNQWHNLQHLVDERKRQLSDMGDLYKFFNMARDLAMWMETQMRQMRNEDKPRDVSGVELLINNHQSLKAEIDARAENFTICLNLGKDLVNRHHPRVHEVKDKCVQLCMQRDRINDQWRDRWELLQLMLEVYQFARDAAVAEQWLIAQEPYLLNEDLGETLDQVEQLIKKHETFEKSIHAQEERFNALRKLTTLEIKQRRTTNNEEFDVTQGEQLVVQSPVDKTKLEQTRLELYLEEFKTIEERERDAESLRQQEQQVREAEERVRREQEAAQQEALRQRAAEVIDVTKALAAAGKQSQLQSSQSPSTQPKHEGHEEPKAEGLLSRKHEYESVNRKASNRSWDKVYCTVSSSNRFEFYKDQKHFKNNKPLESLSLVGASVEVATDYKKKEHVFRLKLNNGGQYLFHAKSEDEMHSWINRTQAAIQLANGSSSSAAGTSSQLEKTKSLPPPEKRTTSSTSGPGGVTASLKKDFFKK